MTREEFFAKWEALYDGYDAEFLSDLDALLKAERERCAAVADKRAANYADDCKWGGPTPIEKIAACEHVASGIRSLE